MANELTFKVKPLADIKAELQALVPNVADVTMPGSDVVVSFTTPATAAEKSLVLGYCSDSRHCELAA